MKYKFRIEKVDDGCWTVFSEDGWETYYFGNSYRDCADWIDENNGEIVEEW